ncbi:bacitracin ABC transporter permease [Sporosarcina sp. P12(2017)]|uniref:ABC transporter permease n=1 Tax=unclassified Sporosarcina TaxID=2647733 RepID=UPI000C16D760|nr:MULTISPECIES: ABC transporter permease [unclassified Sporosarcina]PIC57123.1 bacitracin ABC transporter permease [Sporosarcina sp. P10]PIC60505.1 bacitracin ABC transporter permease [Sporosarcina sp. P12(2017)]
MTLNQLIFRNIKKNLKHYYVYIFALVFSVGLYFSFVTLQFDPALDDATGGVKGAAAIKTGSVFLIVIVSVFLLYANNLFIKRRSKEIGLFQLIGMTKVTVFRILSVENFVLYIGSLVIGILLGFSMSRLLMLILFKVTGVTDVATLRFSSAALLQTLIVFAVIFVLILIMNALFIKRQSILSLFRVTTVTQQRVKKMTVFQAVVGVFGILLIVFGYYLSSRLFSSVFLGDQLFLVMIIILASVVMGTYLFYKGSVSFIFNLIRKRKGGYLNVNDVLSLSSIMFRMKSNSLLLMIITSVSALSIALLSLSYISYYSVEKSVERTIPADFTIPDTTRAMEFTQALESKGIAYTETAIDLLSTPVGLSRVLSIPGGDSQDVSYTDTEMIVISDEALPELDVAEKEVLFVNSDNLTENFMKFKEDQQVVFQGKEHEYDLTLKGTERVVVLPIRVTYGFVVAVVDDQVFQQMNVDIDPSVESEFTEYHGVDIENENDLEKANDIFNVLGINDWAGHESKFEERTKQMQGAGMIMFIVGFLGLAFLVTSGCILYFKQMDESEDEKSNYTILRKLGYTQTDLLKGVQRKQLFNFGIPLVVGLFHSYFAVKSGWFLFGTEMLAPTIIVMFIYTALYSIFGLLSVLNYKRVIKDSL